MANKGNAKRKHIAGFRRMKPWASMQLEHLAQSSEDHDRTKGGEGGINTSGSYGMLWTGLCLHPPTTTLHASCPCKVKTIHLLFKFQAILIYKALHFLVNLKLVCPCKLLLVHHFDGLPHWPIEICRSQVNHNQEVPSFCISKQPGIQIAARRHLGMWFLRIIAVCV